MGMMLSLQEQHRLEMVQKNMLYPLRLPERQMSWVISSCLRVHQKIHKQDLYLNGMSGGRVQRSQ